MHRLPERDAHNQIARQKRERHTHRDTTAYRGKARRAAVLHTAVRLPCSSFVCFSSEVATEKSTCAEGQGKLHAGYIDLHTSPCHRGCMMSMNFPSTCRIRPGRPRPRNCLAGGKRKHRFASPGGGGRKALFSSSPPQIFLSPSVPLAVFGHVCTISSTGRFVCSCPLFCPTMPNDNYPVSLDPTAGFIWAEAEAFIMNHVVHNNKRTV